MTDDWRSEAECAGIDNADAIFFPKDRQGRKSTILEDPFARARVICGRCPVRKECLEDTKATEGPGQKYGFRAGIAPADRRDPDDDASMKYAPLSSAKHAERMALYRSGASDPAIAIQVGVTESTIAKWRRIHGLPTHRPKTSPEVLERRAAWAAEGLSDMEIAAREGIEVNTIRKWSARQKVSA